MVNDAMAEKELDSFEELQEAQVVDLSDEVDEPEEQEETEAVPEETDASEEALEAEENSAALETSEEAEPVSSKKKLMRSLVGDDDEDDELTIANVRQLLDAAPRWFLSQWKMLLLVLAGIILYITNGYQAQMEMMKETELEDSLKDMRYRTITRVSELTLLCRQSQLEERLRQQGDTTLLPSKVAPFIIKVKE